MRNAFGATARAIAASAPPSAWIAAAGSSFAALTVKSRSELARERQLVVLHVDGDDARPRDPRVLDRQVAEAADPEDGDQVGRACARDLDRLVGRHARAGQGRRVERVDAVRHPDDEVRGRLHELGEAAVDRVAGVPLLGAERLPAGDAVIAAAAGVAEPWHCNAVAQHDLRDAGAELLDDSDALVAGYEGRRRLHRPVAVRRVDVGVAEAGRLDPDEDLALAGNRSLDLLEPQRLGERVHDRRFHQRRCLGARRRRCPHRWTWTWHLLSGSLGSRCRPVAPTIACTRRGSIRARTDAAAGFPQRAAERGESGYLPPNKEPLDGCGVGAGTGVVMMPTVPATGSGAGAGAGAGFDVARGRGEDRGAGSRR